MNNKKKLLRICLNLIFLIVFNIVFFVLAGTKHNSSTWLSYAFIHVSYILLLITPYLVRKSSSGYIFGLSLSSISTAYFLIELVVGIIFIVTSFDNIKAAIVINVIITGIYLALLLGTMIFNESTADSLQKEEQEVAFIKNASSKIKLLIDKTDDKELNKNLENVYDYIHSSPFKSNQSVKESENDILYKIGMLEATITSANYEEAIKLCKDILRQMEIRNSSV